MTVIAAQAGPRNGKGCLPMGKPGPVGGMTTPRSLAISPTAAGQSDPDVLVLSTGDVRIPVYAEAGVSPPRRADQPYPPPAGTTALREAVAATAGVAADQVLVTPGARLAIFAVLNAALQEGGDVLLPTPYWSSYPTVIAVAGGAVVPVPGTVGDGSLSRRALDAACTTATRVLVVNSPRNPDGAVTSAEDLRTAVSWASSRGITVLFDQVYRGIPLADQYAPSLVSVLGQLPGHCVVVDGLSKSHALAGLRIGWAIGAGELLHRALALASHLLGGTSMPGQDAAVAALRDTALPRRIGTELSANLDRALAAMADIPGVHAPRPAGGIFLCPDLRSCPPARHAHGDVAAWLKREHRVAVVDGTAFGAPGHIRLSFALPADQLDKGLQRLRSALLRSRDA
jgi:aspartate aminotransferase